MTRSLFTSTVKTVLATVAVAIFLAAPPFGHADPRQEIDGVVIDRTRTRSGSKFYQEFVSQWEPPPGAPSYIIVIQETPHPQSGSMISVQLNDGIIFRGILPGRVADIPTAAARSVEAAGMALITPLEEEPASDLRGTGLR